MNKIQESHFIVSGMDCEDEINAVRIALKDIVGIREVIPNIVSSQILVKYEDDVSLEEITQKIRSTGLIVQDPDQKKSDESIVSKRALTVLISGILLSGSLLLGWFFPELQWLNRGLSVFSIFVAGSLIAPKAWRAAKMFSLDMNILMTVAAIGAISIGEYMEAASVVFLFALAEWLESFSLEKARRSIKSLLKLVPETALVLKNDGGFDEVPISNVPVDSVILVRSGARIPLDGVVKQGVSSVNQAPITGESLPVRKKPGDRVLAGTINGEGSLDVVVQQGYRDTKIAQIIKLIEDAQSQKAPAQRFVDAFAKYYTPAVFVLSIVLLTVPPIFLGADWNTWIYRALVLLVIACPCALVISTPISIVCGLTAMAKRGVLIKGGSALEAIGKLRALAVDKTGTITEGTPKVLQCHSMNGMSENEILAVAASIDRHSTHPLAMAVVSEAKARKIDIKPSVDYRSVGGRGAEATIDGHTYFVGNHRFAHDFAICSPELERKLEAIEDEAHSVVVVGHRPHPGCQGEVLGVLGLGDSVRDGAKEAVQILHKVGIESVIMLSGDNQRTVNAIAKQIKVDEAYGDLLPEDKVIKIKEIKSRFQSVAMIGDGVNDAPAMASASIGIAMGASGTDTAIETSDITLMQDRLSGIADAIFTGKRTLKIIWFNTSFAVSIKFVFLVLSISGHSSLWLAIAADTGATILVIANSLRLLKSS